jgi:hypothetical protein
VAEEELVETEVAPGEGGGAGVQVETPHPDEALVAAQRADLRRMRLEPL